jgi:hypothetical protein
MKNMEHKNCWEFWNCSEKIRSKCPAFLTYHGMDCFDFAENDCPKIEKGFNHCSECPWYKKIKSNIDK